MKIAIIQSSIDWENPEANRNYFEKKINTIRHDINLILLPEMFTSGFTMNPSVVTEDMDGKTITLLKTLSKTKNCAIAGSMVIREKETYFNRFVFIFPSGDTKIYDKRHLFTLAGEDKIYTPGKAKLIVEYMGFRICPLICYDLRFPVFSRNVENYDVLVYVANWPKSRINAWNILLKGRAVENMCYTIGVNRIGVDGNNLEYSGHSQANDFLGNSLLHAQEKEGIFVFEIDKQKLLETRNKLSFLDDRDIFEIKRQP
jgi:omega-amidase